MSHAFSSLDELGDGPGFRKVRAALGSQPASSQTVSAWHRDLRHAQVHP